MLMRRANFWPNLLSGIASSTLSLVLLPHFFLGAWNWPVYIPLIFFASIFGYRQINDATQTLEISESGLIYQSTWTIVELRWDGIGGYVLNDERFVAFDRKERRVLLDIGLRASDYLEWPVGECSHTRQFIERKMGAVGAARVSSLSLSQRNKVHLKP